MTSGKITDFSIAKQVNTKINNKEFQNIKSNIELLICNKLPI